MPCTQKISLSRMAFAARLRCARIKQMARARRMLVFARFACDDGSRRVLARLVGSRQAKKADIAQRRVGVGDGYL